MRQNIHWILYHISLHKYRWDHGLFVENFEDQSKKNETILENMLELSKKLDKRLEEEKKLDPDQKEVANVGKIDPRKRLTKQIDDSLKSNIVQLLGSMVNTMVF